MEIHRVHLVDKSAVIADRVSDRDVVIVRCNGKRRADSVLRVVTLTTGTQYTRITAANVLEHLDSVTDRGDESMQGCMSLVRYLVAEYAKKHDEDDD